MESTLLRCIHILTTTKNLNTAIQAFLQELGNFCSADRAYIIEYNHEKKVLYNTFEWCASGVASEKELLQGIDIEVVSEWNRRFAEKGHFYISSVETDLNSSDEDYRLLEMQGIQSLMAAPLMLDGRIEGFIGVDNPQSREGNIELLQATADFVLAELDKRRLLEQLEEQSYKDLLTGVYNRNRYIRDLQARYKNVPQTLGMIVVDVNGLKGLNDQFGHRYGDSVLKKIASILRENAGNHAVYRAGGDEFILPCPDVTEQEFNDLVNRLHSRFDQDEECSVSMGSSWKGENVDIDEQILSADELMYGAKETYYHDAFYGGGRLNKSNVTAELFREIEEGRFITFFQPQVNMFTGQIVGAEALVRKLDEKGDVMAPGKFVPLYESQGIQMHLDIYVFKLVLAMLMKIPREKRPPYISVNFTRNTLMIPDIANRIIDIIGRYKGVDKSEIVLEITESVSSIGHEPLKKLIADLHRVGLRVALDDFGTKYSNLAILTDIGFDIVKLDKSLVDDIVTNTRSQIVLRNVVRMCRELGVSIVVEGVETEEQHMALKGYMCHVAQGYLFHAPMSEQEFVDLLDSAPNA